MNGFIRNRRFGSCRGFEENEMKELLKRELNKTYLVLTSEGEVYEESYELEMILRNTPKRILPLRVLRVDGEVQLYYEISSKQSLKDCALRAKLSGDLVRVLFETIEDLMKETEEYLLDAESILFDLEHIYMKEEELFFCYCPWSREDCLLAFREMLEEILSVLDYHDTEGVALTYHLYQAACKGDFRIGEVLKEHCQKVEFQEAPKAEEELSFAEVGQYEFMEEDDLEEAAPETEVPVKKERFLHKLISFFLKKEEEPDGEENVSKKERSAYEIPYPEPACEIHEDCGYTQVLEPVSADTVLLGDMPHGNWRLRPLLMGYEEFCITADSFVVGKKRSEVDGQILRESVSRVHSRFFVKDGRLFVTDANSTNGTFVNGELLQPGKMTEIFAGDRIMFADVGYECYNSL